MLETLKSITKGDFEDVEQLFDEIEALHPDGALKDEIGVAAEALKLLRVAIVEGQALLEDIEAESRFALTPAGRAALQAIDEAWAA